MTLKERVLALLAVEALDDDQLAARLGVVRQQVNQTCRAMEYEGLLARHRGPSGKIVNRLRRRRTTTGTSGSLVDAVHARHANHRRRRQGCRLGLAEGKGV